MRLFSVLVAFLSTPAIASPIPPALPPFPDQYREFVTDLPEQDLNALRLASFGWCQSPLSKDPAHLCMLFQDTSIIAIVRHRRELAGAQSLRSFADTASASCAELTAEHGGDARILDLCLESAARAVRVLDE